MSVTARIVETPDEQEPYKVVFEAAGKVFAEQPVNSRRSGDELIKAVLPVLDGFEIKNA